MNGPRARPLAWWMDQFLAGARLSGNQHIGLRGRHLGHCFQELDHRVTLSDEILPVKFFIQPVS